jgi:hypothetical protein
MASIIRIKRSSVAGNPGTLAAGELAYSSADVDGGHRLYVGVGSETAGNAAEHVIIGGKYYTDLLTANAGEVKAGNALIVDADKKLNELLVDNITINGNALSASNDGGNVNIIPGGGDTPGQINLQGNTAVSGDLSVSGTINATIEGTSSNATRLASNVTLDFSGSDAETDDSDINGSISFNGSEGTVYAALTLDAIAGLTAGTHGSSSKIPVITVDTKGRITSISTQNVATSLALAGDNTTSGTVNLLSNTMTFTGGTGIDTGVSGSTVTISANSDDIKDIVGAMAGGANEKGLALTYDSVAKVLDVDVADFTVTLGTGPLSGSFTVTDLADVTFNTTLDNDSVTLGTHTTGDYVASVASGTGIVTIPAASEGAAVTVALADTAVTAGSYGSATAIPTFTVDAQGRLTAASAVAINANSFGTITATDTDSGFTWVSDNSISATSNAATVKYVSGDGIDVEVDVAANAVRFTNTGVTDISVGDHLDAAISGTDYTITVDATAANTASAIVARDANGDFSATTANLEVLNVDNITIDGNTISSTDTDGNVIIDPNGDGILDISANTDITGNLTVTGNLVVTGDQTVTNVTELVIEDALIHVASGNDTNTQDFGWVGHYSLDGGLSHKHAGIFRRGVDAKFYVFNGYDDEGLDDHTSSTIDPTDGSFSIATVVANVEGALTGNADTATALETARTIALSGDVVGSVSFDGTGNVDIATTIQPNSVALGTDTTGDYVKSITTAADSGITLTNNTGETAEVTVALDNTSTAFTDGVDARVATIVGNGAENNVSVSYNATTDGLDVSVATATTSTKGVASFDSEQFTVTSGAVSITVIDGGEYTD